MVGCGNRDRYFFSVPEHGDRHIFLRGDEKRSVGHVGRFMNGSLANTENNVTAFEPGVGGRATWSHLFDDRSGVMLWVAAIFSCGPNPTRPDFSVAHVIVMDFLGGAHGQCK